MKHNHLCKVGIYNPLLHPDIDKHPERTVLDTMIWSSFKEQRSLITHIFHLC